MKSSLSNQRCQDSFDDQRPITLDHKEHLAHVSRLGRYPYVVDPVVEETRLTQVLMDGGSDLNILYTETVDRIGIDWARL